MCVPGTVQRHFIYINIVNLHLSIPSLTFSKDPNNKQPDIATFILNEFVEYSLKIFLVLSIDILFIFKFSRFLGEMG